MIPRKGLFAMSFLLFSIETAMVTLAKTTPTREFHYENKISDRQWGDSNKCSKTTDCPAEGFCNFRNKDESDIVEGYCEKCPDLSMDVFLKRRLSCRDLALPSGYYHELNIKKIKAGLWRNYTDHIWIFKSSNVAL